MKLINADEVIRDLASLKYSKEYGKVGETYNLAIDDCIGEIKATPTALYAEPVKHGKWIPVTNGRGGHECNLCHTYAPSFQSGDEWLTDYCPNCGADMRGKQDE